MKTTVDLDQALLNQAKHLLGTRTTRDTIHACLDDVVKRKKLETFANALGTIPLSLNAKQLKAQRKKRSVHDSR